MKETEPCKILMKPLSRQLALASALMTLILCAGCAKNTAGGDFCLIYMPVFADLESDTAETLRQIDWNNVAYDRLC